MYPNVESFALHCHVYENSNHSDELSEGRMSGIPLPDVPRLG
jgi:hypothetical protein